MTNEQHLVVLYWQAAAALLMGVDYFLPSAAKEVTDTYVRKYLAGVSVRVDESFNKAIQEFIIANRWRLFLAVVFLAIAFLSLHSIRFLAPDSSPLLVVFISLAAMFFFAGSILPLATTFIGLVVPVGVGSVFAVLLVFLSKSPKGPVAAGGMFCLFISFLVRYSYVA
ncbi:MAG: hypothetical protein Q8Q73_01980 [Stagnimonas sp.]|nr:hypothetical protein [Stagnimonas sp.]